MADDPIPPTPGTAADVDVIKPPQGGKATLQSIQAQNSLNYQSVQKSQVLQQQHRTVIAGIATIGDVNTLDQLTLTPSGGYVQGETQAIVDQVNALTQIAAQVNTILEFLKQLASTTIVKP